MYIPKFSDTYEHSIIIACQKHSDLLGYETFQSLGICTHKQFLTPREHSVIALGQKNSMSCDRKVHIHYTHNLYTLKISDTYEHSLIQ